MPLLNPKITIKSQVDEVQLENNNPGVVLDYVSGDKLEITYTGTGDKDEFGIYWATAFESGKEYAPTVGEAISGTIVLNDPIPSEIQKLVFDLTTYGWDQEFERNEALSKQIIDFPSFSAEDRDYKFTLFLNEVPAPPPPQPPTTGYPAGASEYDPDAVMPYEDTGQSTYPDPIIPETDLTINPVQKVESNWGSFLVTAGGSVNDITTKFSDEPLYVSTSGKPFDNDLTFGMYVTAKQIKSNGSIVRNPGVLAKYNSKAPIELETDTIGVELDIKYYGFRSTFDLQHGIDNRTLSRAKTVGSKPLRYRFSTEYDPSTPAGSLPEDPKLIDFSVNADINFSFSSGLSLDVDFGLNVPLMKDMQEFIGDFSGFANAIESNAQTALGTITAISGNSCPLLSSLGNLLDDALKDLADAAENAIPNVMTAVNGMVENVRTMIPEMMGFIGDAFEPIRDAFQPIYDAIGNGLEGLQNLQGQIQSAIDQGLTQLANNLQNTFNIVKGEIQGVISTITPIVNSVTNAFDQVTSVISDISSQISTALDTAIGALENAFDNLVGVMDDALATLNAITCGAVSAVLGSFASDITSQARAVQNFAQGGLSNFLQSSAHSALQGMEEVAETQLANLSDQANNVLGGVTGDINGFINNSQNIISSGINVDINFSL